MVWWMIFKPIISLPFSKGRIFSHPFPTFFHIHQSVSMKYNKSSIVKVLTTFRCMANKIMRCMFKSRWYIMIALNIYFFLQMSVLVKSAQQKFRGRFVFCNFGLPCLYPFKSAFSVEQLFWTRNICKFVAFHNGFEPFHYSSLSECSTHEPNYNCWSYFIVPVDVFG